MIHLLIRKVLACKIRRYCASAQTPQTAQRGLVLIPGGGGVEGARRAAQLLGPDAYYIPSGHKGEAAKMAEALRDEGVSDYNIILEPHASDTVGNAFKSAALARNHLSGDLTHMPALLVKQAWHLPRCSWLYEKAGFRNLTLFPWTGFKPDDATVKSEARKWLSDMWQVWTT